MIVREKFTAAEWRRAFAKHSKLGYPSDDSTEYVEENILTESISPVKETAGRVT